MARYSRKNLAKTKQKVVELTCCKTLGELEQLLSVQAEGIAFVSGKGKRKTEEQRGWETIDHLCQQCRNYEEQLVIMGKTGIVTPKRIQMLRSCG